MSQLIPVFPGHRAYVAGTPGFDKVLEAFGRDIVGENGEVNRQALGKIVFGNKVSPTIDHSLLPIYQNRLDYRLSR